MSTDKPAVPDASVLCSLAQAILHHVQIVVQHAALPQYGHLCLASFEFVWQMLAVFSDHEIQEPLNSLAKVSRGDISLGGIHGRSATEWTIGLGRFLQRSTLHAIFKREGKESWLEAWRELSHGFVPNNQPDKDKKYLAIFSHHAPDRPVYGFWKAPLPQHIRELSVRVGWEMEQLKKLSANVATARLAKMVVKPRKVERNELIHKYRTDLNLDFPAIHAAILAEHSDLLMVGKKKKARQVLLKTMIREYEKWLKDRDDKK